MFVCCISLDWLLVFGLYKEDYLQIFKCVSFWLHSFRGKLDGLDPINRFNHTSWVDVVTSADHPKSVRNRSVIKVLVTFLYCHFVSLFNFSVGVEADLSVLIVSLYGVKSIISMQYKLNDYLF